MDRSLTYCAHEGRGFFSREWISSDHNVLGIWSLSIYLLFINYYYLFHISDIWWPSIYYLLILIIC